MDVFVLSWIAKITRMCATLDILPGDWTIADFLKDLETTIIDSAPFKVKPAVESF
jgi:hypothetical protein